MRNEFDKDYYLFHYVGDALAKFPAAHDSVSIAALRQTYQAALLRRQRQGVVIFRLSRHDRQMLERWPTIVSNEHVYRQPREIEPPSAPRRSFLRRLLGR